MPSPLGNSFIKTLVNSPLHPLVGRNIALITVTGCKTGKSIETPINVVRVGESLMVISLRDRTRWRNLRGGRTAQLHHIGKNIRVRSEVIETPAEVAAGLTELFNNYPGYEKYFKINLNHDGHPDLRDIERAAGERVLVKLRKT